MPAFDLETLESRRFLSVAKSPVSIALAAAVAPAKTTPATVTLATVAPATVPVPAYAAQIGLTGKLDPTPTFDDEFDGNAIDTTKWQVREATRHRVTENWPDMAVTDRSSVVVKNGELQLIAFTDPVTGQYRSGWIQSDSNGGVANDPQMMPGSTAHFEQEDGYWESKIKFSSLAGMWSAFWVHSGKMTSVGDDPAKANHPEIYGTEMDVVENGQTFQYTPNQNNQVHATVHANGYGTQHISTSAGSTITDPYGYHTYGLLWTKTSVTVYVDGYQMYKETNPNLVSKVKQFAILSNEIGVTGSTTLGEGHEFWGLPPTTNGGYGDVNTSQAKMTVDYVRVWALTGTSSTPVVTLPPATLPTGNIFQSPTRSQIMLGLGKASQTLLQTPIRSERNDLTVGELSPIL